MSVDGTTPTFDQANPAHPLPTTHTHTHTNTVGVSSAEQIAAQLKEKRKPRVDKQINLEIGRINRMLWEWDGTDALKEIFYSSV